MWHARSMAEDSGGAAPPRWRYTAPSMWRQRGAIDRWRKIGCSALATASPARSASCSPSAGYATAVWPPPASPSRHCWCGARVSGPASGSDRSCFICLGLVLRPGRCHVSECGDRGEHRGRFHNTGHARGLLIRKWVGVSKTVRKPHQRPWPLQPSSPCAASSLRPGAS